MANVIIAHNDNTRGEVKLDRVTKQAFLRASRKNADKFERVEALLIAGVKPTAAARWVGVPEFVAHRINHKLLFACAAMLTL